MTKGEGKDLLGSGPFAGHCSECSFELTGERGSLCPAGALSREGIPCAAWVAGGRGDLIFRPVTPVLTALAYWRGVAA